MDLVIYQEIMNEIKPDFVIECGTYNGGSALFFASILDLLGRGSVITIDTCPQPNLPQHPRISYLTASSIAPETIHYVSNVITPNDVVMVVLDSDHTKDHVLAELELYHRFVTKGSYMIVEDTNINGNPVLPDFGPGPMEAVKKFIQHNHEFVIDQDKHKFFFTFNPFGYLKKI